MERENHIKRKAKELQELVIGILAAWKAGAGLEKGRCCDERNWS